MMVNECLLYLCVAWLTMVRASDTDCQAKCDHHKDRHMHRTCLDRCMQADNMQLYDAIKASSSLSLKVRVQLNTTILDLHQRVNATVFWEAANVTDVNRQSYTLSVHTPEPKCQQTFGGYYKTDIAPTVNHWNIPFTDGSQVTQSIMHGCSYIVKLKTKQYKYNLYSRQETTEHFQVPRCLSGTTITYCQCEKHNSPRSVQGIKAETFVEDNQIFAHLSWQFQMEEQRGKRVKFIMRLGDLLRHALRLPGRPRVFKYRRGYYEKIAKMDQTHYKWILPVNLSESLEYKISVDTVNEQMCHGQEVHTFFIANATTKRPESSPVPPSASTTIVSEGAPVSQVPSVSPSLSTTTITLTSALAPTPNTSTPQSHTLSPFTPSSSSSSSSVTVTSVPSTTSLPIIVMTSSTSTRSPVTMNRNILSETHSIVVMLPVIAAGFLFLLVCVLLAKLYVSRKKQQKVAEKDRYLDRLKMTPWMSAMSASYYTGIMETNILYTDKEIAEGQATGKLDMAEISYERIRFGRVIGSGAFGLVYLGTAESIAGVAGLTTVAIKKLKSNATGYEQRQFLDEIHIMKQVGHHANIVTMMGCCTLQYPQCMLMEYVPFGDLKQYLQNLRKQYDQIVDEYRTSVQHDYIMQLMLPPIDQQSLSPPPSMQTSTFTNLDDIPFADDLLADETLDVDDLTCSLDPAELQSFAVQIACGMAHIEQVGVTHRDLAARNILVGHGKVLKISDFGLSRNGIYVKTTRGVIPLRWLSVEAMRDNIYSTKSDVWAYGIVLWEICTLGGFPYPTVSDKDLLTYLENGHRLEKPASCSDQVFNLMHKCWSHNPNHRPSFAHIRDRQSDMLRQNEAYVHFTPEHNTPIPDRDREHSRSASVHTATLEGIDGTQTIGHDQHLYDEH